MADLSPGVSVIIPSLNSPIIDRTLDALRAQRFDMSTVEILVVGLDEPGLIVEDNLVSCIVTDGPATPAQARNIGFRHAAGELLCLIDADCIPSSDWLTNLTGPFADANVMVAGGGVTFEAEGYWALADNVSWFYPYLAQGNKGIRPLLPSLNMCVRRSVIDDVGMFNESYPKAAGEDAEWTTRMRLAGHKLYFLPGAVVRHRPSRSTLRAALAHAYTYGRYSVKINPDYVDFLDTPATLQTWWAVIVLSPVMAAGVSLRVYLSNRHLCRYWYTAPAVFLSKVVWCFGLAKSLRQKGSAG